MRPSWVEVDLRAVAHNVATLARIAHPAPVCAVVKADGYGHGDVPVAETALGAGAACLAVALVEEGIRLREAGIEAPILLLSEPSPAAAGELVEWRLTPTAYRAAFLDALEAAAPHPIDVHLKVDTGMHRVGAPPDTVVDLARQVVGSSHLRMAGLWSHLAVAEEDADFTAHQVRLFEESVAGVRAAGAEIPTRHLANTAGSILHPTARLDMVRTGIGVYGLHPCEATRSVADLRPAMRVVSHVAYLRRHPGGSRPSYGRRRALPREMTVATIPVGYADGVPRLLSDRGGEVLIRSRRYPLAGTVTMDQIMVEVGDDPLEVGDEVVLIGRQGDEEVGADEWASRMETINYEIVCQIGPRLPRRYRR
ncbi:MAG: alanine racemase [Acidimicrobiia bacterium]